MSSRTDSRPRRPDPDSNVRIDQIAFASEVLSKGEAADFIAEDLPLHPELLRDLQNYQPKNRRGGGQDEPW